MKIYGWLIVAVALLVVSRPMLIAGNDSKKKPAPPDNGNGRMIITMEYYEWKMPKTKSPQVWPAPSESGIKPTCSVTVPFDRPQGTRKVSDFQSSDGM